MIDIGSREARLRLAGFSRRIALQAPDDLIAKYRAATMRTRTRCAKHVKKLIELGLCRRTSFPIPSCALQAWDAMSAEEARLGPRHGGLCCDGRADRWNIGRSSNI